MFTVRSNKLKTTLGLHQFSVWECIVQLFRLLKEEFISQVSSEYTSRHYQDAIYKCTEIVLLQNKVEQLPTPLPE